jgi:hypothetical protein
VGKIYPRVTWDPCIQAPTACRHSGRSVSTRYPGAPSSSLIADLDFWQAREPSVITTQSCRREKNIQHPTALYDTTAFKAYSQPSATSAPSRSSPPPRPRRDIVLFALFHAFALEPGRTGRRNIQGRRKSCGTKSLDRQLWHKSSDLCDRDDRKVEPWKHCRHRIVLCHPRCSRRHQMNPPRLLR